MPDNNQKTEKEQKTKSPETTGLDVIKHHYRELGNRTPREAIENNLKTLKDNIRLIGKKISFNRLVKQIEHGVTSDFELANRLEVLWLNGTLGIAKNPYEHFYYASLTLTILSTLALEDGEIEKAWSYIAEGLSQSGALLGKEQAIFEIKKDQTISTNNSVRGAKAHKRYDTTKELIKELLITKRPSSSWLTATDATNSIIGELQANETFKLSELNAKRTIRKWLIHDKLFVEFGFKF